MIAARGAGRVIGAGPGHSYCIAPQLPKSVRQPTTVDELAAFVRKDCPSWARAVKAANLRPD
jgi:hypothetical protein